MRGTGTIGKDNREREIKGQIRERRKNKTKCYENKIRKNRQGRSKNMKVRRKDIPKPQEINQIKGNKIKQ